MWKTKLIVISYWKIKIKQFFRMVFTFELQNGISSLNYILIDITQTFSKMVKQVLETFICFQQNTNITSSTFVSAEFKVFNSVLCSLRVNLSFQFRDVNIGRHSTFRYVNCMPTKKKISSSKNLTFAIQENYCI